MDMQITPKTVLHQAVERLRQAILSGMFEPGERLSEARLCKLLGISRPSIREALRVLEAAKLVTIIPNKGPHIPALTREQAVDLYSVRMLLEGEACALSATRRSAEDVRVMREALDHFSEQKNDPAGRIVTTSDFYDRIMATCGNEVIHEILQSLHDRVCMLRAQSMSIPGRSRQSLQEMQDILDAIESRNPDAARSAAVHHVRQAEKAALQILGETRKAS